MKIFKKKLLIAICLLAVIASIPIYLSINKVYADDTGFYAPSANATGSTGDPCSSPGNAYLDDGVVAKCKTDNPPPNPGGPADSQIYSTFNFPSFPSGAVIDGIEVLVDGYRDCGSSACNSQTWKFTISLYDGAAWTAVQYVPSATSLTTVDTQYTIGDSLSTAFWGGTWTVSSFSNANFKLEIQPYGHDDTGEHWLLDYIAVKVYYHTPSTEIQAGDYVTFTQGAYGGPGAPYDAMSCNFASVFSSDLVAGAGYPGSSGSYTIDFTTATAVQGFLPQGGSPGVLDASATNPAGTAAGVLASQVLTNNINLALSTAGASFCNDKTFGGNANFPTGLGSLKISTTYDFNGLSSTSPLRGMTVSQFVTLANTVLGGGALPNGVSVGDISTVATAINECFDEGSVYTGALVM
jgi:hypothetical protein